ncbi:Heat stress transcription factor A-8 [Sesamum alatum]|uniref:Heat stress transcription factor n=1 Tax=Sesamum alatum TaxID=300844 RepID=A0AAE1Y448_9LAMI|nr:Heat stress transcription factor A-8 [Sesamum alatum]
MVKSVENGTSLPPFLVKCYEMVNDESTDELISWTESNDSFIIWDESKFSSQLLPKYFKHSNFSSFVRQLNIYGFRKIDTDRWQFANEAFIKGQKHLLKNISRRKQPQNLVQKKSSQQKETETPVLSEEDKRMALWKEVETLKSDKISLTQELKNLSQHQQTSQSKLLLLREQLKGMEKNQQQMLSFIVMAMQSPEFMVQFLQPKENSWRMTETGKNKLSEVTDDCEPTPSDGTIVRYEPPKGGQSVPPSCTTEASNSEAGKKKLREITDDCQQTPSDGMIVRYQPPENGHSVPPACTTDAYNTEDLMELDFTSDQMRDLLMDIDLLLGPMDEKLLSLENHGQFVLPDVPEDDTMLEQLLLSNPSTETQECAEIEAGACTNSGLQIGLTLQPKESEEPNDSDNDVNDHQNQVTEARESQIPIDASNKMDVLTKQMGLLTSEISCKQIS